MGKNKNDNRIEEIADEARESFDLGDFLRGRPMRTKTVTVFTDEVTAEKRGGFEAGIRVREDGQQIPFVRSWGLVKELAEAKDVLEKTESKTSKAAKEAKAKVTALESEIRELTEKMLESALDIELRSIPDEIKKDAYRAARKRLGIRGKNGVTEDNALELEDENAAQVLKRTVVSITKRSTGEKNVGVSLDGARALKGQLPDSEWSKLSDALDELLFTKVIADKVTADLDF